MLAKIPQLSAAKKLPRVFFSFNLKHLVEISSQHLFFGIFVFGNSSFNFLKIALQPFHCDQQSKYACF